MQISAPVLLAILAMAVATYSTRVFSYLLLRNRPISAEVRKLLDLAPCCVMMAVVGPSFMTTSVPDLLAIGVAIAVSLKKNLALTVIAAVAANALFSHLL